MHSKKAIEISLTTLMGLAVAAVVLVFVIIPLIGKAYGLLVKKPNYVTEQSFERVVYMMQNLGPKESAIVPVQLESDYKITTNGEDSSCIKNCICLCNRDETSKKGCLLRIHQQRCFKDAVTPVKIAGGGISSIEISKNERGISFGGDVAGNCEWRTDSNDCIANECRMESNYKDYQSGENFRCVQCIQESNCAQYSRTILAPSSAAVSPGYDFEVSPLREEVFKISMQQCFSDPCKLSERNVKCFWNIRKEIINLQPVYYGECGNCLDLDCDEFNDIQNTDERKYFCELASQKCNGACSYDASNNKCEKK